MPDNKRPKVLVIMATYNGGRFVGEQIESILEQEDVDVHLYIADDRSSDNTQSVCREYADLHPEKVTFVVNEENLGVTKNFMYAFYELTSSGAYDYVAFSDQDDIWAKNKLSYGVNRLQESIPDGKPALFYSDVTDFDDTGERSAMKPYRDRENYPGQLLLWNWVNGCAMLMNAAMVDLVNLHKSDDFPRYHDVWVHMIARYCATVVPGLDVSLSKRRISGQNVIGAASEPGIRNLHDAAFYLKALLTVREDTRRRMAEVFFEHYRNEIKPEYVDLVENFSKYPSSLRLRLRFATDKRFWKPTLQSKTLSFFGFLLGWY